MTNNNMKKQVKITKLFRKKATQLPEDNEELQDEVQKLEEILKEKQDQLFQLQRNKYRCKTSPLKRKAEPFVRPEKIVLTNSIASLKRDLELMSLLSGIEVQSYVAGEHCAIVYHMQHKASHEVKHGLMIEMKNGHNKVAKSSLPLGFNLSAVLDGYENVMLPECLVGVQKALIAYYSRLEQFEHLKKMLKIEAQLFKILDGSHIEITFAARNEHDTEGEQIGVTLLLDYRIYDIRPKRFSFDDIDIPEGVVEVLRNQCTIFKKKPLHKAFKAAFIDGNGSYVMVQQIGTQPVEQRKRPRLHRPVNPYNDDTFHPEDYSESEDDVD